MRNIRKIELFILFLVVLMLSVGPSSLYVKLFNFNPPFPTLIVEAPILVLMILNIVVRLREAVLGVFSALPYMCLALLALASYKWSLAPAESFKDGLVFVISAVYVVMAAYLFDWRDIIRASWLAMMVVSLISLFMFVAMPKLGQMQTTHPGALSGMWFEKNYAGQIGVFGAALTFGRLATLPKKAISSIFGLFVFSAITLLSTSRTSLMALVLCMVLAVWVFAMRRNRPVFVVTLWATIVFAVPLGSLIVFDTESVLKLLGRNATFTGRAQIWEAVFQFSLEDAGKLGYGYNAYWSEDYDFGRRALIFEQLGFEANHSHNSVLELWLSLGLAGVTLFTMGVVATILLSLSKIRRTAGVYFAIPFLGTALVIGLFESTFASGTNFGGVMLVLIMAKMFRFRTFEDAQSGLMTFWRDLTQRLNAPQSQPGYIY